ncbi:MAG TPA: PAS domain-containing protein, partial [Oxalicibacterium sp.]|nr:PAS domain-containing protein [Oxalicibacterium sp.]
MPPSNPSDPLMQVQLLGTLLSNLDGMVYRCRQDAYWTMEFVSQGCFALTGYKEEELLFNSRVSYEEIVHPDDRDFVRIVIEQATSE